MSKRSKRRKLKADINVVPYIDVMLVLLIIFMVTAPMLQMGVDVKLPEADAKAMQAPKEVVRVSVTREGRFLLALQNQAAEPLDEAALEAKVAAFVRQDPNIPVVIDGDMGVEYGLIYRAMATLQRAGVTRITFRGEPNSGGR